MIENDKWIAQMAQQGMISPFEPNLVRKYQADPNSPVRPVISYGLSSYGYDIRLSPKEFRIFRHIPGTVVDPKNFNPQNLEPTSLHTDDSGSYFILPAHSYGLGVALERLQVPDNITVICIGKSSYARCFRGDTRVALVDGTSPTLEEMAERAQNGEQFWGYSIGQHGRVIVTLLENPRYIDRDALLKITLDNERSIFCTPDHLFLTRDGRLVEAHTLRPQDSLMPLYRQLARGYEMVYQPLNGYHYPTHRLSDEWNLRNRSVFRRFPEVILRGNTPRKALTLNPSPSMGRGTLNSGSPSPLAPSPVGEGWGEGGRRGWGMRASRNLADVGCSPFKDRSLNRSLKNHKVVAVEDVPGTHDVYCLTVPEAGNFALEAGVFVHNCGIIANLTPAEAAWRGHLTLEFSNSSSADCRIYANEGVVQLLFFEGEPCAISYETRQGKYQDQAEIVTLARV